MRSFALLWRYECNPPPRLASFSTDVAEAAFHVAELVEAIGAAGHGFHHVFHFVRGAHHFAHLAELFEQGVDFLQGGAGAFGDGLSAFHKRD